jgi:hypothetical protein
MGAYAFAGIVAPCRAKAGQMQACLHKLPAFAVGYLTCTLSFVHAAGRAKQTRPALGPYCRMGKRSTVQDSPGGALVTNQRCQALIIRRAATLGCTQ